MWEIMMTPKVVKWYESLSEDDRYMPDLMLGMLSEEGVRMKMPHSRALGKGLFELRFMLQRGQINQRLTYAFDTARTAIILTQFRKTRNNEATQIRRARKILKDFKG